MTPTPGRVIHMLCVDGRWPAMVTSVDQERRLFRATVSTDTATLPGVVFAFEHEGSTWEWPPR